MDTLDMVCDKVYCELDEINKKEKWDSKDVELIGEFVDILKDIDQISFDQYGNGSYSQMGGMRGRSGRTMPMYRRGRSMSSRDENKEMMLDHLQEIMDMAVDEKDRKAVERLMTQMQNN